jgi:hypothetical protein
MDNKDKFSVNVLPPKDAFYNDLTKSHISDEDYDHAKNVWEKFEIRHMGEYHDLYLKSDVLQLADVFERFRDECLSNYGLDPAHASFGGRTLTLNLSLLSIHVYGYTPFRNSSFLFSIVGNS